jgi:FAD synthase
MKASLRGTATRPAATVIGTWDPFLPEHRELFDQVGAEARANGLSFVAVMLDPPPPRLIRAGKAWPLYDDSATRVEVVRRSLVDAVLVVRLSRSDVGAGAREFLDLVRRHVALHELWLGQGQSLGPGPNGSPEEIARLARRDRFRLRRLDAAALHSSQVRDSLSAGRIADAIALVGRPPSRRRPRGERVRLDWAEGWYEAVASTTAGRLLGDVAVQIRPSARFGPVLDWPDRRIGRLAFVRGPADARLRS